MRIYRGPMRWIDRPGEPQRWEGPAGAACLDTRTMEQQATAGGPEHDCIFVARNRLSDPDYELLAEGDPSQTPTSQRLLDALPGHRNRRPTGDTLERALVSLFGSMADPDGIDGPKPIVPGSKGRFVLVAGGCVIRSERHEFGKHELRELTRTMIQRQVRDASAAADRGELPEEMVAKAVGYQLRKYGIPEADWRTIVPPNLRARVGRPRNPETSVSDDFNRADGGLGANWGSTSGMWEIAANQVRRRATTIWEQTVFQTALSGSDHWAQIKDLRPSAGLAPTATVRKDNSTTKTAYVFYQYLSARTISKLVSGTQTNLASTTGAAANTVLRIEADGSTISAYVNPPSTALLSTTDTSITGNLYTGMATYTTYDVAVLDDFAAEDLGPAPGGVSFIQLESFPRGMDRGLRGTWGGTV